MPFFATRQLSLSTSAYARFCNLPWGRSALALATVVVSSASWAIECRLLGLSLTTGRVVQIREAGQEPQETIAFNDASGLFWFLPLQGERIGTNPRREACLHNQVTYWRVSIADSALAFNADTDTLDFLDMSQATQGIDGRQNTAVNTAVALNSLGVNYQLAASYTGNRVASSLIASASGDLFAYRYGWYFTNQLAWTQNTKISRYESYALKESTETGTYLRLGDAVTSPTGQGESLQFAGVSWGTDRALRPNDFSPVLPTLRNGNVLAGPLEVFINDTLQFQQTVRDGVVDLRNLPAQQGFNSYRVRTLDAQGNPVSVLREIYLPSSLLPPGITAWRIDAGFQREDFFTRNASYGPPVVSGSYSTGVSHDLTLGTQALITRGAASFTLEADQRLSSLWTGHIGAQWARNTSDDMLRQAPGSRQGSALQVRLDGGGRDWRLLAESTQAAQPLPGLGTRAALRYQRLLRAQWNGLAGWSLGLAHVQSQNENRPAEAVSSLSASTRVSDSGASLSVALTQTNGQSGKQKNLLLAMFFPLSPPATRTAEDRNRSVYLSQNSLDGAQLSRAQFTSSGQRVEDSVWGVGATRDSQQTFTALDGAWSGSTRLLDLSASARIGRIDRSALVSMRGSVLRTEGQVFATRPINGAFAVVSTGEPDIPIFYENRQSGQTDAAGLLLVPGLLAQQVNRLSVDPSTWPIHWLASQVERQVIPPRGGGVLVSFKINAMNWVSQPMVIPLSPAGIAYRPGAVAVSLEKMVIPALEAPAEAVVDRRGQLWTSELAATGGAVTRFAISQDGKRCRFTLPPNDSTAAQDAIQLTPDACEDTP